jgi:hypothetical protein
MTLASSLTDISRFRRPPEQVMRLARMGAAHPTRLSFLRVLLARVQAEGWLFDRPLWEVDGRGVGRAVYRIKTPERSYSLVAFAHDLPDHLRSDRVIATAWDATFALFDGTPSPADLDLLQANVPLQEAGRVTPQVLTLSRANRSVRLFAHTVDRLARGLQPDRDQMEATGYLMRTTAVYGSGKFGAADRTAIAHRPELAAPFQAEMLTVWLIRAFTVDLVEHLAALRGGGAAVALDQTLRRRLGVGNSTGLGMAPFLIRHPTLLNNWMLAREEALARVRAEVQATPATIAGFEAALQEARQNADRWQSAHPVQQGRLADLRADLGRIAAHGVPQTPYPWNALWLWAETALSLEGQEALVAALLEPHGALVDGLAHCMDADEDQAFLLDGSVTVAAFRADLLRHYSWALETDYALRESTARFWYVSAEKLEPRLGQRHDEAGAALELPLDIGRMAQALAAGLATRAGSARLARFLLAHPEHRFMARRVQQAARHPYAEIQDNLIAADMLPIDMLRCKLAFFGASQFDPRSDRWVRISLFQGQPYPQDLTGGARV